MEVREVALRAGESYELRLTGRGARGYVWIWQVTGDADAVSVREGPPPAPREVLPGASVELVYVVHGRCPGGRARIRFAQIRPPYPDEAPYDEFVLEVAVTGGD
ncbi:MULTISPECIES: protease inhibitor I42 family protein [unclassified Streptomyces]|uniref:protease inhibitor I42 family protein n=1 Tax=unclassified Streptomyces TaxID=2593676 RepID=UPI001BE83B91|nr:MULTISPECIES: protease inhibitor I42 family protein [unclassified Streptomyces]MBT2404041.1 hypothetical protein [Streptomyces sp. ISL-21]MBT2607914.1 hypothetical protein [Streptomyces sp. ISL-87]